MAKKPSPDEPVDGPFKISDSMFPSPPPDESDSPEFTDDEVRAIMGEEQDSWVTEGEPELPPPPPYEPPPPPTPPAGESWITEGEPELNPHLDGPDPVDPDATKEGPAPEPRPPAPRVEYESAPPVAARRSSGDTSGLVTDYDPNEVEQVEEDDDSGDIGSSAMTYLAIGIVASMVGVVGALVVVLVLTAGGGEPVAEEGVLPENDVGNIQVRKTLKAPPKPTRIEENIQAFEEREAARARGELVEEDDPTEPPPGTVPVPGGTEAEAEPEDTDGEADDDEAIPLSNVLD